MTKYGFWRTVTFAGCFMLVSAILVAVSALSAQVFLSESRIASADEKNQPVVIIDAGHGGRDAGASADDGTPEKDLNLAVAKKLELLFATANVTVIMTRTGDTALGETESSTHKKLDDLRARVDTMNKYTGATFVSIHMNRFPVSKYSGLQVYYTKNESGSQELADSVQSTVKAYLQPENARETKAAGSEIYVLDKASCRAILIECGFLSNPEELGKLKTDEYQTRLAVCIFAAIMSTL